MSNGADNFYKSDKLIAQKVTFKNQYQMKVVGNLVTPKDMNQNAKNPAIIVGHPMGAVKNKAPMAFSVFAAAAASSSARPSSTRA